MPIVGEQGRQRLPEPVGQQQWRAGGGQDLRDVMDHVLGHGQRALAHVERQQHRALRVHGHRHPVGGTVTTRDRLCLADRAVLDGTEQGLQCIELPLADPYVVQGGL
jgi:hypothetical protein